MALIRWISTKLEHRPRHLRQTIDAVLADPRVQALVPHGFDRERFHEGLNETIRSFLHTQLGS